MSFELRDSSDMKTPRLKAGPARQLTDRECAKLLGGTIGCLATMADARDVVTAVQWWAEHVDSVLKHEIGLLADAMAELGQRDS